MRKFGFVLVLWGAVTACDPVTLSRPVTGGQTAGGQTAGGQTTGGQTAGGTTTGGGAGVVVLPEDRDILTDYAAQFAACDRSNTFNGRAMTGFSRCSTDPNRLSGFSELPGGALRFTSKLALAMKQQPQKSFKFHTLEKR